MKKIFTWAFLVLNALSAAVSQAEIVASYDFNSGGPTSFASVDSSANTSASNLNVVGATPTLVAGMNGNAIQFTEQQLGEFPAQTGPYLEFSVTVTSGSPFDFLTVSMYSDVTLTPTASSPGLYVYANSGFTSPPVSGNLASPDNVGNSPSPGTYQSLEWAFNLSPFLVTNGTTLYFRLYPTDRFASGGTVRIDNLQVEAVQLPVPASFALLASGVPGLLGAGWVIRRRKRPTNVISK